MNKINITQQQVDHMIVELIYKIQSRGIYFNCVVGIANGGLHVSRPIAKSLNLEHKTIHISHYKNDVFHESPYIGLCEVKAGATGLLICDDLTDGGHSLQTFDKIIGLKGNYTAVLFCGKNSIIKPDFYVEEKPDAWLVLPWEIE